MAIVFRYTPVEASDTLEKAIQKVLFRKTIRKVNVSQSLSDLVIFLTFGVSKMTLTCKR